MPELWNVQKLKELGGDVWVDVRDMPEPIAKALRKSFFKQKATRWTNAAYWGNPETKISAILIVDGYYYGSTSEEQYNAIPEQYNAIPWTQAFDINV